MKFHRISLDQSTNILAVMLVAAWIVSGCSGSNDSVASDTQVPSSSLASETNENNNNNASTINPVTPEAGQVTQINSDQMTQGGANEIVTSEPVVADPLTQNTILVSFDITVPAYQSNELSLELIWGDLNLTATWVGDELWAVSGEFPTDQEHLLTVTFYDHNGGIEIARYVQAFETGLYAAESFQISADQFDTNQFDTDADGVNNLAELIAGANPTVDEEVLVLKNEQYLEIGNLAKEVWEYESSIPTLPFYENYEETIPIVYPDPLSNRHLPGQSDLLTIDIDEFGTGSYFESYWYNDQSDVTNRTEQATRTNTGSSIIWSGSYLRTNSSAGTRAGREFTVETEIIELPTGNYHSQTASIYAYNRGYSSLRYSYELTGLPVEGSQVCKPIAGTFIQQEVAWRNNYYQSTVTVTKRAEEQYWKVTQQMTRCDHINAPNAPDSDCRVGDIVDRYLVNSLGENFYCDFLGLE